MESNKTRRIAALTAPKGHCRWCKGPVPKGRKSWCSEACVQAAWIQLSPGFARAQVEKRDKGVCADCRFDAHQAARVLHRLRFGGSAVVSKVDYGVQREREDAVTWLVNLWTQPKRPHAGRVWTLPHLWEADHIVPVVEGGGACDLSNYRTLCVPCHRRVTKELRGRMAARRKQQIAAERLARWNGETSNGGDFAGRGVGQDRN